MQEFTTFSYIVQDPYKAGHSTFHHRWGGVHDVPDLPEGPLQLMDVGGEVVLSSAVYTLTRCPCSIKQPFPHAHARNPHEAQRAT